MKILLAKKTSAKNLFAKKILPLVCVIAAFTLCVFCASDDDEYYGAISGIVTDFATGVPIVGAGVTLSPSGRTQTTGNDGRYEFNNLTPGQSYNVTAQKAGYRTDRRNATVSVGVNMEVNIALIAEEE